MRSATYSNRAEAGRMLAGELRHLADRSDVTVLALPRGGVPVGFEMARALHAPLDIFLVRKLGVPQYEELAMGAIASGGIRVLNESVIRQLNITPDQIERIAIQEQRELERRERAFRDDRSPAPVAGRICVLVDDGLATGSTMRAAVLAVKAKQPLRLVMAVPVAASDTCAEFQPMVDEVICPYTPEPFLAVGRWYDDFSQLTDEEVRGYLESAAHEMAH